MRIARLAVLGVALACPPPSGAAAQSAGFIVTLGTDTVVVEQYTRTAERLEGWYLSRTPQVARWHYVATFAGTGDVQRFDMTLDPGPGDVAQHRVATFRHDSAIVDITRGDSTRTLRVAIPPGTLPFINQSYAVLELVTRRARAAGAAAAAAAQHMLALGANAAWNVAVATVGPDSMLISIDQGLPLRVRVDSAGLVLGASGKGTTQQFSVGRRAGLDFPGLAARLVTPLGQLSQRDTARLMLGGAEIVIDYGRPAKRGRVIFGDLVPWDAVWRTGANAATVLRIATPIVMEGVTVPAGSYSLWTIPSRRGWKLVLNRQTKNAAGRPLWGTEYDPTQDFLRLDLATRTLDQPVERFTIALEPTGAGGLLSLSWDTTAAAIQFRAP